MGDTYISKQQRNVVPEDSQFHGSTGHDPWFLYITPADVEDPKQVKDRIIKARVTSEVALALSSEYGPLWDSENAGLKAWVAEKLTGRSGVLQEASKQMWRGSSEATFAFELIFVANDDPKKDVRDQITQLYRLVTPTRGQRVTVPPDASWVDQVVGIKKKIVSYMLKPPGLVNLDIPNILSLTNMVVTEVNFAQAMKLMRVAGEEGGRTGRSLPMQAQGSITVMPQYMLLTEDIRHIFIEG